MIKTDDLPAGYFLCDGDMLSTKEVQAIFTRSVDASIWGVGRRFQVVVDYEDSTFTTSAFQTQSIAEDVRDSAIKSFNRAKATEEEL